MTRMIPPFPVFPTAQVATPYLKRLSETFLDYKHQCNVGTDEARSYAGNDIVGVAKTIPLDLSSKEEQLATVVALCAVCNDRKMHDFIVSDAALCVATMAQGPYEKDIIKTVRKLSIKNSELLGVVNDIAHGGLAEEEDIGPARPLNADLFGSPASLEP